MEKMLDFGEKMIKSEITHACLSKVKLKKTKTAKKFILNITNVQFLKSCL